MKYEVNEKKFYKIEGISDVKNYNFELKHLDTTFDLEKYNLEVVLEYEDLKQQEQKIVISLPIELATTMTEQLSAFIKEVDLKMVNNDGVELDITLAIEVLELNVDKEEIHDTYQAELETKLQEREEVVVEDILIEKVTSEDTKLTINTDTINTNDNLFNNLKTEYVKYKVLSLEESSFDKISAKYNLPSYQ